ncbi:glycerophosphoryl diester phosphodiesterase [Vibrio sinaloensis DSM 21326]|uniref:Glycerophosphoryl diester phosphodiesterase n=1 Tax=Vibrio sinaloensis DSM 21326 TaxID=945550 RepID=E8M6Z9_PHOS4|nr:glycerophosphodiester phosphodiesterase family protein [Vibrio sinaloensis]EGA70198.1 glycerophosphoryl diester phosphodiesterase [Vibrio sinaloensis DSM 21326]
MIVVGHRGVAGHYPENTRISIEAAIRLGLEWIEVDVQPSKDNVLVVCHDHTVDRCSNGSGRVDELNLAQLRALDFAQNHKKRFPQQTIMTLAELLDLAITENVKLNLEVKVDHHDPEQVVSLLTEAIDDSHIQSDNILFSSFNHDVLRQLRIHFPSHAIAVLSERLRKKDRLLLEEISAVGCNLNHLWTTNRQINQLKQQGYQVWCYTVNNPNRLKHLKGLDGIFSDFPERFL